MQQQGITILGVDPKNYFTPRVLEELKGFEGWEFYGRQIADGTIICGVVKTLTVLWTTFDLAIDFEWLSFFREGQKNWVAKRPMRMKFSLVNYYGKKYGPLGIPEFSHVLREEGKPVREFCLYPAGFFEASDRDRASWLRAKFVSVQAVR